VAKTQWTVSPTKNPKPKNTPNTTKKMVFFLVLRAKGGGFFPHNYAGLIGKLFFFFFHPPPPYNKTGGGNRLENFLFLFCGHVCFFFFVCPLVWGGFGGEPPTPPPIFQVSPKQQRIFFPQHSAQLGSIWFWVFFFFFLVFFCFLGGVGFRCFFHPLGAHPPPLWVDFGHPKKGLGPFSPHPWAFVGQWSPGGSLFFVVLEARVKKNNNHISLILGCFPGPHIFLTKKKQNHTKKTVGGCYQGCFVPLFFLGALKKKQKQFFFGFFFLFFFFLFFFYLLWCFWFLLIWGLPFCGVFLGRPCFLRTG